MKKPIRKPTSVPQPESLQPIGLQISNVGCGLPPDNEYTNSSTIELAKVLQGLASAISATARAVETISHMPTKGSVKLENCTFTAGKLHPQEQLRQFLVSRRKGP